MRNLLRTIILLAPAMVPVWSPADANDSGKFCDKVAKLPWHNSIQDMKDRLGLRSPVRTLAGGEGEEAADKEIAAIEELVKPNRLSSALVLSLKEYRESDYSVFVPRIGKTYYFGNIAGSAQCHYDSWGVLTNSEIQAAGEGPDLGDGCWVERYFGQFENEDILVQYASKVVGGTGETPLTTDYAYDEVRVVRTEQAHWNDVCVIKLP